MLRRVIKGVPLVDASFQRLKSALGVAVVQEHAIAIYRGDTPWTLAPVPGAPTPAITRRDVTDVRASFVADPFLVRRDDGWYLFFEVMPAAVERGVIAVASSDDTVHWSYRGVVLSAPHHLSYPHVFTWRGETYMVPETHEAQGVHLYRAAAFPDRWEHVAELVRGAYLVDATLALRDDGCYLFVGTSSDPHAPRTPDDTLRLLHAPEPAGPWSEHPASPLVRGDALWARPAGRIVEHDGALLRFAMDCGADYGKGVRARAVEVLTPSAYRDRPLLDGRYLVGPGRSRWNRGGMHHVDLQRDGDGWIAAVDGWRYVLARARTRARAPAAADTERPPSL